MILGDLLARLNDDSAATELILALGGLTMLRSVQQQAEVENMELAIYARVAVQRYAAKASDEEWITVMSIIGRASDPGLAYVKRAIDSDIDHCTARVRF